MRSCIRRRAERQSQFKVTQVQMMRRQGSLRSKRAKQTVPASRTQKPILPLTRGKLAGRKIMLPHSVWPEDDCDKYNGAGWFAEISSERYGVAGVRIGENIYHFKVDSVTQWEPLKQTLCVFIDRQIKHINENHTKIIRDQGSKRGPWILDFSGCPRDPAKRVPWILGFWQGQGTHPRGGLGHSTPTKPLSHVLWG